jgi:hypothetical protein
MRGEKMEREGYFEGILWGTEVRGWEMWGAWKVWGVRKISG